MLQEYHTAHAAEFTSLAHFRAFIEQACQHAGIADDVCYDLKLAVDEACTNIIEHGYAGMNPGSIVLRLKIMDAQMIVTITDFGRSFEPAAPPAPDIKAFIDDPQQGGFGLHFIYQTMDSVYYEATDMGNQLSLIKHLSGPNPSA